TVVDHKRTLYFFESAMTPNTFWVDVASMDLAEGTAVRKLGLGPNESTVYSGDSTDRFERAEAFTFAGA
ncbi:choloylglycine hydrolase, partial [Streptomyces sp. NPDC050698]